MRVLILGRFSPECLCNRVPLRPDRFKGRWTFDGLVIGFLSVY